MRAAQHKGTWERWLTMSQCPPRWPSAILSVSKIVLSAGLWKQSLPALGNGEAVPRILCLVLGLLLQRGFEGQEHVQSQVKGLMCKSHKEQLTELCFSWTKESWEGTSLFVARWESASSAMSPVKGKEKKTISCTRGNTLFSKFDNLLLIY